MENQSKSLSTDVVVHTVPAKISVNFDELRATVEGHLEKFKGLVIGPDSIKSGKDLIKEINQTRKDIDQIRKAEITKASVGIKDFDQKMKELIKAHDDAKSEISEQIAHHEAKTKERIRVMLQEVLEIAWETNAVAEEFRNASIDDLVLLGSMTPGGKIKGNINSEIHIRADRDKALQQQTELRLARLEADSYKAGLSAPLTRSHVEQFLFDDEATYGEKLDTLFAAEVKREEVAVEAHRKRQERENAIRIASAATPTESTPAPETTEVSQGAERASTEIQTASQPSGDERIVVVTATFSIPVASHIPVEAVVNAVKSRLEDAEFTTLTSVSAEQKNSAA